jgi:GWxTD domain-containing protein
MKIKKFNYKSCNIQKLSSFLFFQKIGISFISLAFFLPSLLFTYGSLSSLCLSYQERTELKEWLDGPIRYIITDDERKEFKKLALTEEKQKFIRWFWARRDPNPDSEQSEFREEFYRRVDYANENFKEKGLKGWETARGMVYIIFGPPENKWEELIPGKGSRPAIFWLFDQFPSALLDPMKPLFFVDIYRNGHYYLFYEQLTKRSCFDLIPSSFYHVFKEANEKAIKNVELKLEDVMAEDIYKDIPELPAIPFQWKVSFEPLALNSCKLNILVTINYKDISYYQKESTYNAALSIAIRLLQSNGNPFDEVQNEIKVSLTEDELKTKAKEKLKYDCSFSAPTGEYYIEIELKDIKTGISKTVKKKLTIKEDGLKIIN